MESKVERVDQKEDNRHAQYAHKMQGLLSQGTSPSREESFVWRLCDLSTKNSEMSGYHIQRESVGEINGSKKNVGQNSTFGSANISLVKGTSATLTYPTLSLGPIIGQIKLETPDRFDGFKPYVHKWLVEMHQWMLLLGYPPNFQIDIVATSCESGALSWLNAVLADMMQDVVYAMGRLP